MAKKPVTVPGPGSALLGWSQPQNVHPKNQEKVEKLASRSGRNKAEADVCSALRACAGTENVAKKLVPAPGP